MILVDTGPLVALFDPNDAQHRRCRKVFKNLADPLFTTVPVLTVNAASGPSKPSELNNACNPAASPMPASNPMNDATIPIMTASSVIDVRI